MKKTLILTFLILIFAFSLSACKNNLTPSPSDNNSKSPNVNQNSTASGSAVILTKEQAKFIALDHAGLTEPDIYGLYVEYERDDGVEYYDVDFKSNGYEFDYEIGAINGEILKSEKELID